MPPFKALFYFCSVFELSSVSLAADRLCVSQSAVSKQLKILEYSLQEPLFRRERGGLVPTEFAHVLYEGHAARIGQFARDWTELRVGAAGSAIVAGTPLFMERWLEPHLLAGLRPLEGLTLTVETEVGAGALFANPARLVVYCAPSVPEGWTGIDLFNEELCLLASGTCSAATLARLPLADFRLAHSWYWDTGRWLSESGNTDLAQRAKVSCSSYYTGLSMALQGRAMVIGCQHMFEDDLTSGRLQRVSQEVIPTGNVYRLCFKPERRGLARQVAQAIVNRAA